MKIDDEIIQKKFQNVNFGNSVQTATSRRGYIIDCVLKNACGYSDGYAIRQICYSLGLMDNHSTPTEYGLRWAFDQIYKSETTIFERLNSTPTETLTCTSAFIMDVIRVVSRLIKYAEINTCPHEETRRGGAIWTICDGCGMKWSDDEGAPKPHQTPFEIVSAEKMIKSLETILEADSHKMPPCQWESMTGICVLNSDGWGLLDYKEPITRDEFLTRCASSRCSWPPKFLQEMIENVKNS